MELVRSMDYSLKVTTPYEYFPLVMELIPTLNSDIYERTFKTIEFMISIPEAVEYGAEEIFFGCLMVVIGESIDELTLKFFNGVTDKTEIACRIAGCLSEHKKTSRAGQ